MWQALWEQYSACLKPLLEGDPDLQGVKAKLLQRGLFVGKQLILVHGLARRVPPASLWQELHAYYRLAEMLDCTVQAVSDDLMPHAVGISCYSTYCHALLLGLADGCALSVRQIELTDRWLGQWARKVFPYAQQRENEGAGHAGRPRQLRRRVGRGRHAAHVRGRPALRLSREDRDERPRAAEAPRRRRQSRRAAARPRHVGRAVRGAARRTSSSAGASRRKRPTQGRFDRLDVVAGGLNAAYFRVGGRTFDRKDPLGRLTFHGTQHLTTLGALTDYDRDKDEAEKDWPWERWQGSYEWTRGVARAPRARPLPLVLRPAGRRARRRAHAPRPRHPRRARCGGRDRARVAPVRRRAAHAGAAHRARRRSTRSRRCPRC